MEVENNQAQQPQAKKQWWELELEMQENQENIQVRVKIDDPKQYLVNVTAACLLQEGSYYQNSDERRYIITKALLEVAESDPEFICQLAVYIRNELYIRTTTNYIVAFCVVHKKTQPFIEKYFNKAVLLPNDLLEACEFAQVLYIFDATDYTNLYLDKILSSDIRNELTFRKCLQRCVRSKFSEFNEYQLGKYCTESQRKKTMFRYLSVTNKPKWNETKKKRKEKLLAKLKAIKESEDKSKKETGDIMNVDDAIKALKPAVMKKIAKRQTAMKKHMKAPRIPNSTLESKYLTFKDLIKFCHISEPKERVFKILGKKYPKTEEEFKAAFGDSASAPFNPELAGKRMKIEISKTWENELSAKGNTAEVWDDLISSNQLPYMAMLRNLSNILKAGVSDSTHSIVINKICEPKAVENSKMFPLQFFSAIEAVNEAVTKGFKAKKKENMNLKGQIEAVKEVVEKTDEEKKQMELEQNEEGEFVKVNEDIGKQYINSIELAIKIAVNKNLDEIKGHTAIFSDVSGSMSTSMSGGAKKYGSVRTCLECALVLGLMVKQRCEKSSFYIFSSPSSQCSKCYLEVNLPGDELRPSMEKLLGEKEKLGGGTDFPYECIDEWTKNKTHVDNIVILSDMMIAEGYSDINVRGSSIVNSIKKYKDEVNPNIKIFAVDLEGYGKCINLGDEFNENNYIKIFGMSDSILKFISAKQGGASMVDVIKNFALQKIGQK
ncbi:hypothetical protein ABPG72_006671 [Tetrahymena utriculariae]